MSNKKTNQSQQEDLKKKKGSWLYRFHNDSNEINESTVGFSLLFVSFILLIILDILSNNWAMSETMTTGFFAAISAALGLGSAKSATTLYIEKRTNG